MNLQQAFDAGFEAVKSYVDSAISEFEMRLAAIEKRESLRGEKGDPGRDGKDGIDGQHGKDGAPGRDGNDGPPGERGADGAIGKDGAQGIPGRDGRDGAPGINGKDGASGQDGKPGIDGKDGERGLDGKDGFSLKDFHAAVEDGGRVLIVKWTDETVSKEFRLQLDTVLDRGVFKEGTTYERGDMVTWGGSGWTCQKETNAKPGDGSPDWRLFVKKGRDGRDGKDGEKGERGLPGKDGRDRY